MPDDVTPYRVEIPEADLRDLWERLARTRWPEGETVEDWSQGLPLAYMRELCAHWADGYDWRATEARLNALPQFRTEVDGLGIHFVHVRSRHPEALPLVMTHGWPGSVVEFLKVIGPLTDPTAHGGAAADAFHVVCPSLPGYAFSDRPAQRGWNVERIAAAWVRLMARLGYERYGAQGGDWGSVVCANVADLDADHVAGLHLNFVVVRPPEGENAPLTPAEQRRLDAMAAWRRTGAGYQEIQGTKPQTLGYALEDSPAGLAAWIVEKFAAWSDCDGDVERSFTKDQLLTNVMAYWVTATATSSTRLYYEMRQAGRDAVPTRFIDVPTGIANYPAEITAMPRRWVEHRYNVVHWAELPRGGHFAAMEVPDVFVDDVRTFFQPLR